MPSGTLLTQEMEYKPGKALTGNKETRGVAPFGFDPLLIICHFMYTFSLRFSSHRFDFTRAIIIYDRWYF